MPKGKKIDKDKPVVEGLALMKKQVLTEEGELNSFITAENKKIKREGTRLLNQVDLSITLVCSQFFYYFPNLPRLV